MARIARRGRPHQLGHQGQRFDSRPVCPWRSECASLAGPGERLRKAIDGRRDIVAAIAACGGIVAARTGTGSPPCIGDTSPAGGSVLTRRHSPTAPRRAVTSGWSQEAELPRTSGTGGIGSRSARARCPDAIEGLVARRAYGGGHVATYACWWFCGGSNEPGISEAACDLLS